MPMAGRDATAAGPVYVSAPTVDVQLVVRQQGGQYAAGR